MGCTFNSDSDWQLNDGLMFPGATFGGDGVINVYGKGDLTISADNTTLTGHLYDKSVINVSISYKVPGKGQVNVVNDCKGLPNFQECGKKGKGRKSNLFRP